MDHSRRAAGLPDDPADQLELAHRIANAAFVAQTQSLAKERDALKDQCAEMKARSKQLERRVASMEDELHDAADKATMAMEERDKLTAEKTALINTVKKLNKEVAKLDAFKRNLMQTLADDGEDGAGGAGDAAGERLVTSVLASADANENRFGEREGRYGGSQTSERSPERVSRRTSAAASPARLSAASPLGEANGGDGSSAAARKVDGKAFSEKRARVCPTSTSPSFCRTSRSSTRTNRRAPRRWRAPTTSSADPTRPLPHLRDAAGETPAQVARATREARVSRARGNATCA